LPYTIPASLLALPIIALCNYIFTKIKDHAFRNSIRFVANLVLWPLLMIIYAVVAYCTLPWQWALPITLALLPAPIIAHETWRLLRLFGSDIKLLASSPLRAKYREIREIIFNN
jgi:FtsH-binding integral membrane protein